MGDIIMNDTSTKVFLALQRVAMWVFADCYVHKEQMVITADELLKKKAHYWVCFDEVKKETLDRLNDKEISVGEFFEGNTEITIKANSFQCSFCVYSVFELLVRFSRLAREEKILKSSEIKAHCTFSKTFAAEAKQKEVKKEIKQETKKPVIIAVNVPKVEQPKQTNHNPYNSDYAAMLAAQLREMMSYSVQL